VRSGRGRDEARIVRMATGALWVGGLLGGGG
jgi:hypothetical protein